MKHHIRNVAFLVLLGALPALCNPFTGSMNYENDVVFFTVQTLTTNMTVNVTTTSYGDDDTDGFEPFLQIWDYANNGAFLAQSTALTGPPGNHELEIILPDAGFYIVSLSMFGPGGPNAGLGNPNYNVLGFLGDGFLWDWDGVDGSQYDPDTVNSDIGCPALPFCTIDAGFYEPRTPVWALEFTVTGGDYELYDFAVPEPGTMGLLGAGLAGLAWLKRRRTMRG